MKKLIYLSAILIGVSSFAQLSKIDAIKKEYSNKHSQLLKQYKKKNTPERMLQEEKISTERIAALREAIEVVQNNEEKHDFESFRKEITKQAEFETGITGFRKLFAEIFDSSSISSAGTLKTMLQFVIDENGDMSNAFATGENEEFNLEAVITLYRIKEKNMKWTPAEFEGNPVKSIFRFPATMIFK